MATLAPMPQAAPPLAAGSVLDKIDEVSEAEFADEASATPSSGSAIVDQVEAADPSDDVETAAVAEPVAKEAEPSEPAAKTESKEEEPEPATEEAPSTPVIVSEEGLEIPETTVFTKKVDGRDVKISIKELLDDFSGKTAVKTRFAEANQIKQKAESLQKKIATDLAQTKSVINRFLEAAKVGQQRDALDALCELTGADPQKTWEDHQKATKDNLDKYFSMTDEERILFEKDQDASYWKRKALGQKESNSEQLRTVSETQTKLEKVAKESGLTHQDLTLAHSMLLDLVDKGVYNKSDITVDVVANEALNIKIWGQIDEFTKENLPQKHGDAAFYREVLNDTRKYNITKDQWLDLVKDVKSNKPNLKTVTSKLAEKVQRNKPFTRKPQVTKSKVVEDNDYISFDEI